MDPPQNAAAIVGECLAFHALDDSVKELLAAGMREEVFEEGALVLHQGEPGEGVFLCVEGEACVVLSDDRGRRRELATLGPSEVFGEMSLMTKAPVSADVVAKGSLRVLYLGADDFRRIATEHPEVGIALTYLIADRLGAESVDGLGGKVFDGYRIHRCVGRGNMAVVYHATAVAGEEPVALKMMSHRLVFEPGAMDQFQREADILLSLEHANVANHRRRFEAYGTAFLAMDFCDGLNLVQLVERNGALPDKEVRKILGHLAAALEHLHERDVLHRDMKPSNVMTTSSGEVKLTDFGLARPSVTGGSEEVRIVGSPIYMAPEQLVGEPASKETDLYSLGCIALELLTGEAPFRSKTFPELEEEKRTFELPPAKDIGAGISWRLHRLLRKLLATDPEERVVSLRKVKKWAAPLDPSLCVAGGEAHYKG